MKASEAQKHKLSEVCSTLEYPMGDEDINGAVGIINGRYPDKGRVVNKKCKEFRELIQ